ncbi:unnamed protein product [Effrenium voratum]|uniref:Uncharacterized protein n=1 Tax=Effrenium voratum TaxID=2562239 RepID=A0AA36JM88_9DINO|nr:unnamed protein product [Effrenium voratum]CAJ1408176.1 unnamed protein product [Effrenium voratum]CAJ1455876.1 unnamed protein product [Effrenium voratum]
MPGRKTVSLAEAAKRGYSKDSRLARRVAHLRQVKFADATTPGKETVVYAALRALWEDKLASVQASHLFCLYLACYVVARICAGRKQWMMPTALVGGLLTTDLFERLIHAEVPRHGTTLRSCVRQMHLHSVFKTGIDVSDQQPSDPFNDMGCQWWRHWTHTPLSPEQQRHVLATMLFVLATRSRDTLAFLLSRPDFLLRNCECFGQLYDALYAANRFPGLQANRARSKHTSEQKTWSAERLLEGLLRQLWYEPAALSGMLAAQTVSQLADALGHVKGFGGELVFIHTLEYLLSWDAVAAFPLFGIRNYRKQQLTRHCRHGANSQAFQRLVCAHRQRQQAASWGYSQICSEVRKWLPSEVTFGHVSVAVKSDFCVSDASQNACQAIAVLQFLLSGKHGGKERAAKGAGNAL